MCGSPIMLLLACTLSLFRGDVHIHYCLVFLDDPQWLFIGNGVCRGLDYDDPGTYSVIYVPTLDECLGSCEADSTCLGIEYSTALSTSSAGAFYCELHTGWAPTQIYSHRDDGVFCYAVNVYGTYSQNSI